jgi:hypothetical protein
MEVIQPSGDARQLIDFVAPTSVLIDETSGVAKKLNSRSG